MSTPEPKGTIGLGGLYIGNNWVLEPDRSPPIKKKKPNCLSIILIIFAIVLGGFVLLLYL